MIGILGGTFDPVHLGHLHIAQAVSSRLSLTQLQFMPCALPVHRAQPRATSSQRCEMIELAIAGYPGFSLNRLELERGGASNSVDSLRQIRSQTDQPLVLILGGDAFNGFTGWKEPREILRLAHLVVCHRPEIEVAKDIFADHRVADVDALRQRPAGAILLLEVDAPDCAASQMRAALERGETPDRCLHPAVASYILQHQLYRKVID